VPDLTAVQRSSLCVNFPTHNKQTHQHLAL